MGNIKRLLNFVRIMKVIRDLYHKCHLQALKYRVCTIRVLIDYFYARFMYGFCGEDYFVNTPGFAMRNFQKKDFFSHKKWLKVMKIFNISEYEYLLGNKVDFLRYFSEYINHHFLYPSKVSFEEFAAFVNSHAALLVKPVDDNQGHGIRKYIPSADLRNDYQSLIDANCFVEEVIVQHPKMKLGGSAVNTVRIYTILDAVGKAHVLKAVLRVGVKDSIIDNYHAGGVIYPINVEHGFVESYGISRVYGRKIAYQPGTDFLMLGFRVPNYDVLLRTVISAAESIPQIRYIGWDVAITESGVDIIEANHDADHALFSVVGVDTLFYNKILSYK